MLHILVLGSVALAVGLWLVKLNYKLSQIKQRGLVYVTGADRRYPNLPLGSCGIAVERKATDGIQRVKVLFPQLTEQGDVEYIYSWHHLQDVHLTQGRLNSHKRVQLNFAGNIAPIIQEHLQIDREIERLHQQYQQVERLADLVSTSDLYAEQVDLYIRGLRQIEKLMAQAEALENIYVRLIRETLIGAKVSQYNPDSISDNEPDFAGQYQQLKADYLQMKDEATAYLDLVRHRGEEYDRQ